MNISGKVKMGSRLFLGLLVCSVLLAFSLHKPEPKTHTVQIVQMKFQPAQLQVNSGDKVVFINKDMVAHNVTSQAGDQRISPDIETGKSWTMTVTKSLNYYCSFHPVMKGKIQVKK